MPVPRLALLDGSDLERLRSEASRVLWEVGAKFESAKACDVLGKAGCKVEHDSGLVRFPNELVEWAISRLSRDVLLAARDPRKDALLDGARTFATSSGICPYVVDDETGRHREPSLKDLSEIIRVMDALDEVGLCWLPVSPTADAPGSLSDLFALGCLLANTGKHIQGQLVRPEDVPIAREMLQLAAPGVDLRERPIFSSLYCPLSPLMHEAGTVEAGMAMAAAGIPIDIFSLALSGATGPMTLAGCVVQTLAEELSAAVLFKLMNEECSLILTAVASIMDMRNARFVTAAPEIALMSLALTELIHACNAPTLAGTCFMDSYQLGFRGGLENMGVGLLTWLARPEIAVGMAGVEAAQAISLPKLVLDAEVIQYQARILEGMGVDEERVAVDLIAGVGPGGHFLDQPATVKFLRSGEHWTPQLLRRGGYEDWQAGAPDDVELATKRVQEILAEHAPLPLPAAAGAALDELLDDVRQERTGVRSWRTRG